MPAQSIRMDDRSEAKPAKRLKLDGRDLDPIHEAGTSFRRPPSNVTYQDQAANQHHHPPPPSAVPLNSHHPPPVPFPDSSSSSTSSRPPLQAPPPTAAGFQHGPGALVAPPQVPGSLPNPSHFDAAGPAHGQRSNLEYRESQDQKARPAYHDPRPAGSSYAPPVTHPPRSYSDFGQATGPYPSTGPSPPPGLPPEQHRRSVAGHEISQPPPQSSLPVMDPHVGYPPLGHHGPPVMGNGYPVAQVPPPGTPVGQAPPPPHEQYANAPYGHPQSHPQTPIAPSAPPHFFSAYPQQYSGHHKKKQVRATQACNECRQRKQKCDEERPCGFCKDNDKACEYKEVPASKADRTMSDLMGEIKAIGNKVDHYHQDLAAHLQGVRPIAFPKPEPPEVSSMMQGLDDGGFHEGDVFPSHMKFADVMQYMQNLRTGLDNKKQEVARLQAQSERLRAEIERLESESEEKEKVPSNHKTGVQNLMGWRGIKELFDRVGITNSNYVWQLERDRGLLRIYGQGEGYDLGDGAHDREDYPTPVSNAASPRVAMPGGILDETGSNASSPQDGIWGYGSSTPMSRSASEFKHPPQGNTGGLLANGRLNLDATEIRRLRDIYYRCMHTMHPFLDPERLNQMIDKFIRKYSPQPATASPASSFVTSVTSQASNSQHSPHAFKTVNKRRYDGTVVGTPDSGDMSGSRSPKLEHTISNAIVLLVLAIGKICEYTDHLPPVATSPSQLRRTQINSGIAASPTPSHITINSIISPSTDGRTVVASPRSSGDAGTFARLQKNVDVLPGLAYYAKASDFLGNVNGGTDVSHGQAKLLAGLYMGQLGRAKESWKWIHEACTISRMLVEEEKEATSNESKPSKEPPGPVHTETHKKKIHLLFWSCLLLESDIRAEFNDLPDSGLSKHEDSIIYPKTQESHGLPPDVDPFRTHYYFSAQIYIRKVLNRIHRTLYMPDGDYKDFKPSAHLRSIMDWQKTLHPTMTQWQVNDTSIATEVNDARFRGKYYGAVYICARPFLEHAINNMIPEELPEGWEEIEPDIRTNNRNPDSLEDIIAACKLCLWAGLRSTKAFDGLSGPDFRKRWILPNIPGTVTAQFGNMLILTSAYKSWLRPLIDFQELVQLFHRTIAHQTSLQPILPYMYYNVKVLKEAYKDVTGRDYEPPSANTSMYMS